MFYVCIRSTEHDTDPDDAPDYERDEPGTILKAFGPIDDRDAAEARAERAREFATGFEVTIETEIPDGIEAVAP